MTILNVSRVLLILSGIELIAACDSRTSPLSSPVGPTPSVPSVSASLSGQVFEIDAAGRRPALGVTVLATVLTVSGSTRTASRLHTTTGSDGRYAFAQLPWGPVVASVPDRRLVCGAATEPGPAAQLDVEITSNANPQRSAAPAPLRITGQVFEMTPVGRVGLGGWWIGIDHHIPDLGLLGVQADEDGYYMACGIPAHWPIFFDIGNTLYEAVRGAGWHQFSSDTTVDIEMRRVQ